MKVYGTDLPTRLMLGTAQYPSPVVIQQAVMRSNASVVTVSLRREGKTGQGFHRLLSNLDVRLLPNTAGCHSSQEAVTTAQMARDLFETDWIKLEVIGDSNSLQPDPFELLDAAEKLCSMDFKVFPYTTEDLVLCSRLVEAGCDVLMPWGAPIGSGLGLNNEYGLRALREQFDAIPLIIDAGLGVPSHAARAMELGFDAVLLNTAVAKSGDPAEMAGAFAAAVAAGRAAFKAIPIEPRDMAAPSTPVIGKAFLG